MCVRACSNIYICTYEYARKARWREKEAGAEACQQRTQQKDAERGVKRGERQCGETRPGPLQEGALRGALVWPQTQPFPARFFFSFFCFSLGLFFFAFSLPPRRHFSCTTERPGSQAGTCVAVRVACMTCIDAILFSTRRQLHFHSQITHSPVSCSWRSRCKQPARASWQFDSSEELWGKNLLVWGSKMSYLRKL